MFGFSNSDQEDELPVEHPDVPHAHHAVLVLMVGIALLFFFATKQIVLQETLLLLLMVGVPAWACYMFQFRIQQTFFLELPGFTGILGIITGFIGIFIFMNGMEDILLRIPELQPSQDKINSYREFLHALESYGKWILILYIAIGHPVCEELLFRGFLLRSFRESWDIKAAVLTTGFLFGLVHSLLVQQIMMVFFGIFLASFAWQSSSIVGPILLHALHNFGLLVLADFNFDSVYVETVIHKLSDPVLIVVLIGSLGFMISSLYLARKDRDQRREDDSPGNNQKIYDSVIGP